MPVFRPFLPVLATFLFLLPAVAPRADQASENSLKAGFVYNFAKYTEWPSEDGPQLVVCALGRNALDGQLALLHGRRIGERQLEVRLQAGSSSWRHCDLLFIAQEDGERAAQAVRSLVGLPVLTVGDIPGFALLGGHIELREDERRLQFEINLGAAQRAGLKLSSQMLKLATRVRP
ncbi:MAG: YfiR family protein [Azonexus sp.]|nr:YfiR family protein [Azonexus sp.]MCK6413712.1 YfiR family protein [Azonexus sp.]